MINWLKNQQTMHKDILNKYKSLQKLVIALFLPCLFLIQGCTRNNGDIGPWFGMWQLMEIQTDGVPDEDYRSNIFWSFQNDVFSMNWRGLQPGELIRIQVWGTWSEHDDILSLDFTHSEDRFPPNGSGSGFNIYRPYQQTHLPEGKVSDLRIVSMKGADMMLTYQPEGEETVYTYILRKR